MSNKRPQRGSMGLEAYTKKKVDKRSTKWCLTTTDLCGYQKPCDEAECYEKSVIGEEIPCEVS